VAGCSNPASPGTPPPVIGPPSISCPADVVSDVPRAPATISYTAPIVTGGRAPVATTCTIASGATLPSGTSDILCTATDAEQRSAQCVFHVKVNVTARLQGVTFLAFGDSLTDGEITVTNLLDVQRENSYPTVLQALLRAQYPAQSADIVVINGGASGQNAGNDEDRLTSLVNANNPSAVLILEGVNDVNKGIAPDTILQSLRADIARAYRNPSVKKVFIATLPPQVPGRFRAFNPDGVIDMNEAIRAAAPANQAALVDVYDALYPQRELLIGSDGLHPTVQGYRAMAEAFRAAISQVFEVPTGQTTPTFQTRPSAVRSSPNSTAIGRPRGPR
jgi:lysophospholipase L1-like esterase